MLIGITYDLRDDYLRQGFNAEQVAEFDQVATIDAIDAALVRLGHTTDRIGNVWSLARRLVRGRSWDLVFNIAEGLNGHSREAQVPALLEAYGVHYVFSDPLVCAVTLHKAVAKRLLRDHGIATPAFALVERPEDIAAVDLQLPLFAKPVAEGTSKGIDASSLITSAEQLDAVCRRLLQQFAQPVLVETYLPGRELTVGIIGTGDEARAIAALEVELLPGAEPGVYTYVNKEECERLVVYKVAGGPLAASACELALSSWRALGCRDGGRVDVRQAADGRLQVLEANPLPGLHPTHSDLPIMCTQVGMSYDALIAAIVDSAQRRRQVHPPASAQEGVTCAS